MIRENEIRHKIEPEGEVSPLEVITHLYTDQFILKLRADFNIAISHPELAQIIRDIGRSYIHANRVPNLEKLCAEDREQYAACREVVTRVREDLQRRADQDMAGIMADGARFSNEPLPQTAFPGLTAHQRQRGDAFFHELLRLLGVAEKGLDLVAQRLTSKGGSTPCNANLPSTIIGYAKRARRFCLCRRWYGQSRQYPMKRSIRRCERKGVVGPSWPTERRNYVRTLADAVAARAVAVLLRFL